MAYRIRIRRQRGSLRCVN